MHRLIDLIVYLCEDCEIVRGADHLSAPNDPLTPGGGIGRVVQVPV
jgi:hypothetical protein